VVDAGWSGSKAMTLLILPTFSKFCYYYPLLAQAGFDMFSAVPCTHGKKYFMYMQLECVQLHDLISDFLLRFKYVIKKNV